jgi:hypothetical protein
MADPTVYNYTRQDDLKVITSYTPTVTIDNAKGEATFKVRWKTNGYLSGDVTCTYQLDGGNETAMSIVGGTSGVVTLNGNQREKLSTLVWEAHKDILPLKHTGVTLKLQFNDGTRDIPISETATTFSDQTLDYRKQITAFSLDNSTTKDAFGYASQPQAIFYTPKFHTAVNARPILERCTATDFDSVTAQASYQYSDDNGETWSSSTSGAVEMDDPLKIKMTTAGNVADNSKEYFRVRMHPTSIA